jgi:Ran GTPase-activating protein (RanGAP) involved in mRNA processing and transport
MPIDKILLQQLTENDPSLKTIDLGNLSNEDLRELVEALKHNTSVTALLLDGENKFIAAPIIRELLLTNTSLTNLEISFVGIDEGAVQCLSEGLQSNTTLTSLRLSFFGEAGIDDDKIKHLTNALQTNNTLVFLNLCNNKLGGRGIQEIKNLLTTNKSITTLNLADNNLDSFALREISNLLATKNSLSTLDLSYNSINTLLCMSLMPALQTNIRLTTLKLTGTNISHSICLRNLLVNKTLKSLSLDNNEIDDENIKNFCEALKVNTGLIDIDLSGNRITDIGIANLSAALLVNKTLRRLALNGNKICAAGAKNLSKVLKVNNSLTSIELAGNFINADGVLSLNEALKTNTTLTKLNLSYNPLGDIGVGWLIDMLRNNSTITSINFQQEMVNFGLSESLTQTVIQVMANNYSIVKINKINPKSVWGYPEVLFSYLERNEKIASCIKSLNVLEQDISNIEAVDAAKKISELGNLVSHETILSLNPNHLLNESYRLLTAVAHISNAHRYSLVKEATEEEKKLKLEAEINALECLNTHFIHTHLKKISISLLGYFIFSGTISQQLMDKAPKAFWRLAMFALEFHKHNPYILETAYSTLFKLLYPSKLYNFTEKNTLKSTTALLSNFELHPMIKAALQACTANLQKRQREIQSLTMVLQDTEKDFFNAVQKRLKQCQEQVQAFEQESCFLNHAWTLVFSKVGHWQIYENLPLSSFFKAEFKKCYPQQTQFLVTLHCLFSAQGPWLIPVDKEGSLPNDEQLKKYDNIRLTFSNPQVNLIREEILNACQTFEDSELSNPETTSTLGKRKNARQLNGKPAKKPRIIETALANNLLHFRTNSLDVEEPENMQGLSELLKKDHADSKITAPKNRKL